VSAKVHLHEHVVSGQRLGRHIQHDKRSLAFPAQRAPQIVSVDHNSRGLPLDQGNLGSCTANALIGALNSAPNLALSSPPMTEANALTLYELETRLEGQPYPPNDPGGTGLMVCKAAKQMGLITSYHHAFGIQHALEALVLRPVIFGITWMSSFDQPNDVNGLVEITSTATVRGGHEVCGDGIDVDNKLIWLWNSWGTNWGLGGRFCMSFDTMAQLLENYGDCTVPIK